MKVRIVLNGGSEVIHADVWDVFIEERGTTFHIKPMPWAPAIEVRTESEQMLVSPRTDNTVIVRAVPR